MKIPLRHAMASTGLALSLSVLTGCNATRLSAVTKDPTYDPRGMRRVFVAAVVKDDRAQKMLEDEFVRRLQAQGRQAVASYTFVRRGTELEPEAWKKLISDGGYDTVIISRLVDLKVAERDSSAKVNLPTHGSGYGYYQYSNAAIYQPASYVRNQTASIETRVFDVGSGREVWSAHSTTEIVWGGDPEPQVRRFVDLLMREAKR